MIDESGVVEKSSIIEFEAEEEYQAINLPQNPLIVEFRKHLRDTKRRISKESKKRIKRFSDELLEKVFEQLAPIIEDYITSERRSIDVEVITKGMRTFERLYMKELLKEK